MGKIVYQGIEYTSTSNKASNVKYDTTNSGLDSVNIQGAIDELSKGASAHLVTQAEYDALADDVKNIGVYVITDADDGVTVGSLKQEVNEINSSLESIGKPTQIVFAGASNTNHSVSVNLSEYRSIYFALSNSDGMVMQNAIEVPMQMFKTKRRFWSRTGDNYVIIQYVSDNAVSVTVASGCYINAYALK